MKFQIIHLKNVDSTNTYLANFKNAAPMTLVLANYQTKGRGRGQNTWCSPLGNLYASLLVENSYMPSQLSLAFGLCLVETLKSIDPKLNLSLKWPNDVYINDEKLGGLLIEPCDQGLIIGFGLNIEKSPIVEGHKITCLKNHTDHPFSIENIIESLSRHLEKVLSELKSGYFDGIKKRYLQYAKYYKKPVSFRTGHTGIFDDLSDDGALILKTDTCKKTIYSGDIEI